MEPKPPQNPPEQGPKILTFEEFTERENTSPNIPRYNNFYSYFTKGEFGEMYRAKEYYKRFELEHPDLAASLCNEIQNKIDTSILISHALQPFDRDLYAAYIIMRGYEASDKDLLIKPTSYPG